MHLRSDEPPDPIEREVWQVALVIVMGAVGSILALSSISVALEVLSRDLDAPFDTVQWVATGYLLGLAAVIPTTGWLQRRLGARRLYLTTLTAFVVTSALCALAASVEQLIAFRILQGVAGGAILPVGQMILVAISRPERMGRVMSVVGVPLLLGPLFGPAVGGLLVEQLGWQWIFLMNIPLGLCALVLGLRLLPHMSPQPAGPFDTRGFLLMTVGAPALVYGIAAAGGGGSILDLDVLLPILGGCVALALYVVLARDMRLPLLDVRLWANRGFAASGVTTVVVSAALFGSIVLLPLYFQVARGNDAFEAGLLLMPQGLGTGLSMIVAGRLTDRIGGGRVALVGIVVATLCTIPFAFADTTPYWLLVLVLFVRGLGIGGSVMPAMAAAYATLRSDQIPDATPQVNMLQRIGGSLGTAILSVLLASRLRAVAPEAPTGGSLVHIDHGALAAAFGDTFAWAAVMMGLALIPAAALAVADRRPADLRQRRIEAEPAPTIV